MGHRQVLSLPLIRLVVSVDEVADVGNALKRRVERLGGDRIIRGLVDEGLIALHIVTRVPDIGSLLG